MEDGKVRQERLLNSPRPTIGRMTRQLNDGQFEQQTVGKFVFS